MFFLQKPHSTIQVLRTLWGVLLDPAGLRGSGVPEFRVWGFRISTRSGGALICMVPNCMHMYIFFYIYLFMYSYIGSSN